jgi:biopolymer transport protein TolR
MAGGAKNNNNDDIICDINITPFVDVTLVLLIIFMVTATYMVVKSIPVDLPEAGSGEDTVTTLAVTMTEDGNLYLDGAQTDETKLKAHLKAEKNRDAEVRVIVDADKSIAHGKVVRVIDLVRKEGISKFAINIREES